MGERKFLSWMGFKSEEAGETNSVDSVAQPAPLSTPGSSTIDAGITGGQISAPTQTSLERIRELESQLADLKARRDITSLSKEEFEILATETAMKLIRTAQSREAKAISNVQSALAEANRAAESAISEAESKARSILSGAESRGKKYIDSAAVEASSLLSQARSEVEALTEAKRREANSITSSAKIEADRLIFAATNDVSTFKNWLSSAITESEKLHRVQTQALNAAEDAIKQTRSRLTTAFEKLQNLSLSVSDSIGIDGKPKVEPGVNEEVATNTPIAAIKNNRPRKTVSKKTVKRTMKKTTAKKAAKKATPKKAVANKKTLNSKKK